MTDILKMPDDFWPIITVIGRHGDIELAFAITSKETAGDIVMPSIDALRRAIWQAMHDETSHAMFGIQKSGQSLREIKQGITDASIS